MHTRITIALTAILLAAMLPTGHAADAKITSLSDSAARGADGQPYRLVVVEATIRDRDTGIVLRLDIQASDGTTTRYASVGSGQGTRWISSASRGATAYWAYRVDLSDMPQAKLSYEATLVDRMTGAEVRSRSRGIRNRAEWAAANAKAAKAGQTGKLAIVQDTSYLGR